MIDGGYSADFVIIGAGIVGLTVAEALLRKVPGSAIIILEKEPEPGRHSSGRNSGVLHSGIYYPKGSLKAKLCAEGARRMREWVSDRGLHLRVPGKIILPTGRPDDGRLLDTLLSRGIENGAKVRRVGPDELRELEPVVAISDAGGLHVESTSMVDPSQVVGVLARELTQSGVRILCNAKVENVDEKAGTVATTVGRVRFGHLVNAAGLYADRIAHTMGLGMTYRIVPFRGQYWELVNETAPKPRHLVYPVPELRVPFLGVHSVMDAKGRVFFGPTAMPALGRESYHGWEAVRLRDAVEIAVSMAKLASNRKNGFLQLASREMRYLTKAGFLEEVRRLVPGVRQGDLKRSMKVGIRAQLIDDKARMLVQDFVIEEGHSSTHVLNSVSPAFTCSLAFAEFLMENYIARHL